MQAIIKRVAFAKVVVQALNFPRCFPPEPFPRGSVKIPMDLIDVTPFTSRRAQIGDFMVPATSLRGSHCLGGDLLLAAQVLLG